MAKRTRFAGRSSSRRPGANPLVRRDPPKAKPAVVKPASTPALSSPPEIITDDGLGTETGAPLTARGAGLSQAEIDRAAQLEAEMTARERALEAVRRRAPGAVAASRAHVDVNQPLSIRASHEYDYVARDVRRIILTGSLMVAILAVLDILVNVMGVVQL
jgi:hypothetical protein